MKKFPLTLNLQLFADESPETEDRPFEIDDSIDSGPQIQDTEDGGFEIVDDDEGDEANEEGQGPTDGDDLQRDEAEVESSKPQKNETSNAVIAERRKWQKRMEELQRKASIADKVMSSAGITDIEAFQARLDSMETQRLVDQGYDDNTARAMVQQQREINQMKQDLARQKFDVEVNALKSDPFFSDIDDWRDELEPFAIRTGQSLEAAYMALRGRERMKEYQREEDHRRQASASKKNAARVNTSANGGTVQKTEKHNLTPDQLAMARIAVKNGTFKSVDEYAKYAKKG